MSLHDIDYDRLGVVRVSGSLVPGLGLDNAPISSSNDQLRVRGDSGVSSVSVSSALSPSGFLFPFSDSGFGSFSAPVSSTVSAPTRSSSFPSSSSPSFGFPTLALSLPPSTVPVFSFPSVVPFALLVPLSTPLPSVPLAPPPPGFLPVSVSVASAPPVSSFGSFTSPPLFPLPSSSPPRASVPLSFSLPSVPSFPPVSSSLSSASASSSFMNFASFQARTLGLFVEYQSLARWFVQSGGFDFLAYVSSYFPHLSADASRDFSSGSSLFLSALWSLAAHPSSAVPSSFPPVSSSVLPPSFGSLSGAPVPRAPPPLPHPSSFPLPPSASSLSSAPLPGFLSSLVRVPLGFHSALSASPSAPVFCSFSSTVPLPSAPPFPFLSFLLLRLFRGWVL